MIKPKTLQKLPLPVLLGTIVAAPVTTRQRQRQGERSAREETDDDLSIVEANVPLSNTINDNLYNEESTINDKTIIALPSRVDD